MPQKYSSRNNKKSLFWTLIPTFILTVLLVGGFLLFAISLRKNQDIRQQASEDTNKVVVSLQAGAPDDEHLKIDVMVNTQGYKLAALDFQGGVSETTSDSVKIEDTNSLSLNTIQNKLSQDNQTTNFRIIKFAQPDPNAQTSSHGEKTKLFSIVVTKPKDKKVTINFNTSASSLSFLNDSGIQTEFPGTQTFLLRTQADREAAAQSCNGTCSNNTDCKSAYVCSGGHCRNPKNVSSATCANPAPKPKPTPSVTPTPSPTPSPSPKPLPADAIVLAVDGVAITSPSPTPSPSPKPTPRITPSPAAVVVPVAQPNRWPVIILIIVIAVIGFGGLFYVYRKYYQ